MKTDSIGGSFYDSPGPAQSISGKTDSGNTGRTASSGAQSSTASGVTVSISDYYYDVRDLNRDGVVTLAEEIQYALTHPGEALTREAGSAGNAQNTAGYNQQGNVNEVTNSTKGTIDITV